METIENKFWWLKGYEDFLSSVDDNNAIKITNNSDLSLSESEWPSEKVSTIDVDELMGRFPHMPLLTYHYIQRLIPETRKKMIEYINKGYVQFFEDRVLFSDKNGPIVAIKNSPFNRTEEQLEEYLAPLSRSDRLSAVTIDDDAIENAPESIDEENSNDHRILPKKQAKQLIFQPSWSDEPWSWTVYYNKKFKKRSRQWSVLKQITSLLQSGKERLATVDKQNNTTNFFPIKQLEQIIEDHWYVLISQEQIDRIKYSLFTDVFQSEEDNDFEVFCQNTIYNPEIYALYVLTWWTGKELELFEKKTDNNETVQDIPKNYRMITNPPWWLMLSAKSWMMVNHNKAEWVVILPSWAVPLLVAYPNIRE